MRRALFTWRGLAHPARAFTLAEAMIAISMVAITMGLLGLLFQRSMNVMKVIDDKERARQAGRMGLDRLTCELREATEITTVGATLEFVKINPTMDAVDPPPPPDPDVDPPDPYVPPTYTPMDAYPDSARLDVRYSTANDTLIREVRVKGSGAYTAQVVVVGVNAFTCVQNPANPGEIEVTMAVQDSRRVTTVSSRILCPCIKEEFE